MRLKSYFLLAILIFFGANSVAIEDSRNFNDLALEDMFISKPQFQSLSHVDQLSYLSAVLFLTASQDQIYSLTTYEDNENPQQSGVQERTLRDQTNSAVGKFGLLSQLLENQSHAFLPVLLVRLALTAPVRAQLLRMGGSLLAGAKRVAQILEARALTAAVARSRVQIINMYRTRASLLKAEAKLLKKNDPRKLAAVRLQLNNTNQELQIVSESFLKSGGTKKQLEAALAEANKSGWRKAGEIVATGGALFLGTEIISIAMRSSSTAEKSTEGTGKIEIKDQNSLHPKTDSATAKTNIDPDFCLYGLYPSKKNDKKDCTEPRTGRSPSCQKSEFLCPNMDLALSNVITEKKFCIQKKPQDTLADRCMGKLLAALSQLGNRPDNPEVTWSPEKALELYTQLMQSKFELTEKSYFSSVKPDSKTKIGDYCSHKATSENRNQKAECAAIETLFLAIDKTKAADIVFKRGVAADPGDAAVTPKIAK